VADLVVGALVAAAAELVAVAEEEDKLIFKK
jgi:hypothetical protein